MEATTGKKLKVALCYTGLATSFENVIKNNLEKIIEPNLCDVFISTADVFSERGRTNHPMSKTIVPKSKRYTYLKKGVAWRQNYPSEYGIVYDVDISSLTEMVETKLAGSLRVCHITSQDAKKLSTSYENTKWQWLRNNQLRKIRKVWDLLTSYERGNDIKYDIVINMRMDVLLKTKVILGPDPLPENCIHAFGGWINSRFMDKAVFDGFLYGDRKSMSVYYKMYDRLHEPYENEKYASWVGRRGPSLESQLVMYLGDNGVDLKFINELPKDTCKNTARYACYMIQRAGQVG